MWLLRYLQRSKATHYKADTPDSTPLDSLIAYLEPRVPHTDYSAYQAAGYPIGSGMMESTCKHLVCLRLKGCGRLWNEHGTLAMTSFIALRTNGKWHEFWNTQPQRRAA